MSSENENTPEETGPITEADYNELFCDEVGGELEVAHSYNFGTGIAYVYVDCETSYTVWEGGLDKRSSLDSIQQALFFHHVTGKSPAIVIYDTDGVEERFEYRIRIAAELAGIRYVSYNGKNSVIDNMTGSAFADTLVGDQRANILSGHAGDDTLAGLAGADQLIGGPGLDTADYSVSDAPVTVRLHTLAAYGGHAQGDTFPETVSVSYLTAGGIVRIEVLPDVENLTGSTYADILAGDRRDNVLDGKAGDDTLYGGPGGGDDLMLGGEGDDTIFGGQGADTLIGGSGSDRLIGGLGADTFVFAPDHGADTISDFAIGVDRIDLTAFDLPDNYQIEVILQDDGMVLDLTDVNGDTVFFTGLDTLLNSGDYLI